MTPLLRRLGMLFRRGRLDRELAEEMRIHLEMAADDEAAGGVAPNAARFAARKRFGNPALLKEDATDTWSFAWIEAFVRDVRYAGRTLARTPAFTIVAVLSLALGIGANTAIFTLINAILLRPLPVRDPAHLLVLQQTMRTAGGAIPTGVFSYPAYASLNARKELFEGMFAARNVPRVNVVATSAGEPELTQGTVVTGDYFNVLGVAAAIGRAIIPTDDMEPGASPVVVVSDPFWRTRLGADPAVVGRTLRIEGLPFTVIGVMPKGFNGESVGSRPAFWVPMAMQPQVMGRNQLGEINHGWLTVMARMRENATASDIRARLDGFLREATTAADPKWINVEKIVAVPGGRGPAGDMQRQAGRPLAVLATIVAVVLLIACTNVANLLLARAGARQREIGIRLAIGAGRGRVVRQLLAESVVLASMGAALGLVIAFKGAQTLLTLLAPPRAGITLDLAPDARVLTFTAIIAVTTSIVFGVIPALTATRVPLRAAFGTARHAGGFAGRRLRLGRLLVITELAMAGCLLIGALLFIRSLRNLSDVDPGFRSDNLVLAVLSPSRASRSAETLTDSYRRLLDRVETLPGVQAASLSRHVLLGGGVDSTLISSIPGFVPESLADRAIYDEVVGPRYFETLQIAMRAGRDFSPADRTGTARVAILNESAARFYFRGRTPSDVIGQPLSLGKDNVYEIVGIAGDTKYNSLREPSPRMLYRNALQLGGSESLTLHVRTSADPLTVAGTLRSIVRTVDERIAVAEVMSHAAVADASLSEERTIAILCSLFGGIAIALACIGIYGLLSYGVTRRIPEIGVRLALGARPVDVSWLVVREMLVLVIAGVALAVPGAVSVMQLGRTLLFGLSPTDATTLSLAVVVLTSVALATAYLPARRASCVNPIEALRYE